MYCNHCGSQLPDIANFCHFCGFSVPASTKLEITQPITPISQPLTPQQAKPTQTATAHRLLLRIPNTQVSNGSPHTDWFYFWFGKFMNLIVLTTFILPLVFSVLLISIFIPYTPGDPFEKNNWYALPFLTALALLFLYFYLTYVYFKYISIDKKGKPNWKTIIWEFIKYNFIVTLLTPFALQIIGYDFSKYFFVFILTFTLYGVLFDLPFGRAFYNHYWITPRNIYKKPTFITTVMILFVIDLLLGFIYLVSIQ